MTLAINNNISAVARYNFVKNSSMLADSIEKLSSGLRINRAADDGPSLIFADKLNSQALSLGQAIKNANDGVSIMQIADSSIEEAVSILQTIKTKAIQSSQDSQTSTNRSTIQGDIDTLIEELDLIVKSTKFNDQQLLTGNFSNKRFQVGAYTGEDLGVTLDSAQSTKIGHLRTGELSATSSTGGDVSLTLTSAFTGETLSLKAITLSYSNSSDNGMGALADAINDYSSDTGITARAVVETTTSDTVQSGATSSTFAINDITIGAITTEENDSDNSLVTAINNYTSSHGITASITSAGYLNLVSSDNRPIEVTGAGTALSSEDQSDISTFGYIKIYQKGAYSLSFTDTSTGLAVAFTQNMNFAGSVTTTIDSTMAAGSLLGSTSTLTAGWVNGAIISGTQINGNIATTSTSTLVTGSVLASGSVIEATSILGGIAYNGSSITTTASSYLNSGSILLSNSIIAEGTYLTNTIYVSDSSISAGTTLSENRTLSADATITNDMLIDTGSIIASSSTLTATSYIGGDITLSGSMTMTQDMTMAANSTIIDTNGTTVIAAGSTIGGAATVDSNLITMTQAMTIKSGSVLTSTSSLATGSTIGGSSILDGDHTTSQDLLLTAGSILASSSVIKAGTEFTNNITTTSGIISIGTTSVQNYTTSGTNYLSYDMTLENGSILTSSSTLAANSTNSISTQVSGEQTLRLADLNVLTMEDSLSAIELADAALEDINKIRSHIGAVQNQFNSSIAHATSTKTNVQTARSKIMDIDFAEETQNFTRMQVLVQSGIFAVSQTNVMTGNVLSLLQGGQESS